MQTNGSLWTPAKFIASCQSPSDVLPSPRHVTVTSSRRRTLLAYAMPAACRLCVATGLDAVTIRARFSPKCEGIWRPPEFGSSARAKTASMKSRAVIPAPMQRARSR